MDLQMEGRRALVSGSTQGIGYAVASALAREGARVVLHGRGERRVRDTVARLREELPDAEVAGVAADVSDAGQVERMCRELDALGPVDVLVNNVGVFGLQAFAETTDAAWSRQLEVNLMSGVRLSRHLLGGMLDRGWGRVVFVASESGVDVPADMVAYGVTKAAQLALANGLAKLTRGTAVTVNSVVGGPTWSDGVASAVDEVARAQGMAPAELAAVLAGSRPTSLAQRFLEPDEVASLVCYLASPRSSATNGAALRADGGVLPTVL